MNKGGMKMDKAELIDRLDTICHHLDAAFGYDLEDVQQEINKLMEDIRAAQIIA
jgi:hypothetical protein